MKTMQRKNYRVIRHDGDTDNTAIEKPEPKLPKSMPRFLSEAPPRAFTDAMTDEERRNGLEFASSGIFHRKATQEQVTRLIKDAQRTSPSIELYKMNDVAMLEKQISSRYSSREAQQRMKELCEQMKERGAGRFMGVLPKSWRSLLNNLEVMFPNFAEVIEFLRCQFALSSLGVDQGIVCFRPILLLGEPGIGKTYFAHELGEALGSGYLQIHMENQQNGSSLTGSSEFWNNSQPGDVFTHLVFGDHPNPVIVCDELDKARGDERFVAINGLYQLLERQTATRFADQSVKSIPLDASHINWIFTANELETIPLPLLSRMTVFKVRSMTKEETMATAGRIYQRLLAKNDWNGFFQPGLSPDVAELFAAVAPRRIEVLLHGALGKAAYEQRDHIRPEDIEPQVRREGRSVRNIGFTASL